MAKSRRKPAQRFLRVARGDPTRSSGRPFYTTLNRLLAQCETWGARRYIPARRERCRHGETTPAPRP